MGSLQHTQLLAVVLPNRSTSGKTWKGEIAAKNKITKKEEKTPQNKNEGILVAVRAITDVINSFFNILSTNLNPSCKLHMEIAHARLNKTSLS